MPRRERLRRRSVTGRGGGAGAPCPGCGALRLWGRSCSRLGYEASLSGDFPPRRTPRSCFVFFFHIIIYFIYFSREAADTSPAGSPLGEEGVWGRCGTRSPARSRAAPAQHPGCGRDVRSGPISLRGFNFSGARCSPLFSPRQQPCSVLPAAECWGDRIPRAHRPCAARQYRLGEASLCLLQAASP